MTRRGLRVCSRAVALLNVDQVSVRFGGLQALAAVTIDVPENEVTGLIGPNGAGKTTLFNVITGLQPPTGGTVVLDGKDITNAKPHQRARLGIGRTFQRLETFGTLSVRDNVLVAAEMRKGWSREKFKPGVLTDELIERIGLTSVAEERVDRLPTGTQRLVEMARALATKPRVVLLDEPSSGLNESETAEFSELLIELAAIGPRDPAGRARHGSRDELVPPHPRARLRSDHRLRHARPRCRPNPLVRAAYLGEGDEAEEVPEEQQALLAEVSGAAGRGAGRDRADERRRAVHLGVGAAADARHRPGMPTEGAALELIDVQAAYGCIDVLHGVNITIPPGTVYALLGPNGAGKTTTLKVASGRLNPTGGRGALPRREDQRPFRRHGSRAPACARSPRVAGIFPNLTVLENLRTMTYTRHVALDGRGPGVHALPAAQGTPQADGGHALRW